jgi:nicotinamide phosphoribosyltransferase
MPRSIVTRTDSYKFGHWPVYADGTEHVLSYLESRGGLFPETVFNGLQPLIKKYLLTPVTMEDIDYAEARVAKHFGDKAIFNRKGWEHIVNVHGGRLPAVIKAVPEGTVVPTRNVLMTIENTDPACFWLTNHLETLLLKVWYPTTVATLSREIKKVIREGLEKTGDVAGLPFKLHDFGYRGASSEESAGAGGAAHLINFMGTDTFEALEFVTEFYGDDMVGYSIPATEHSVMMERGEQGEIEQMLRFLDTFGQNPAYPAIACVSDTYDIFRACEYWGTELRNNVINLNNKVLVVRPDSGDPPTIVRQVVETLDKYFGHAMNDKGFKVLNHVRVIQGDGINLDSIKRIQEELNVRGWSSDNIAYGMGGALLQQVHRDTQRFAIKACSYVINGRQVDQLKDPVTDTGKRSKAGRLKLIMREGIYETVTNNVLGKDHLDIVYKNGYLMRDQTFADVRARAELPTTQPAWL